MADSARIQSLARNCEVSSGMGVFEHERGLETLGELL